MQNIPADIKHIHLTAICGTAMGALAAMLKAKGYKVTGSDDNVYPPMSAYLESLGIEIMKGYSPANLEPEPDLAVVGNTVKRINPEAQEIEKRGIPCIHLPKALSELFLKDRHSIVVAGTHGKTTTTALCAWLLESAGLDPGFLAGGILNNFNSNAKLGTGDFFVIEGDEYDSAYFDKVPKFNYYRPKTGIITSVEFDHGDIYRDIDHVKDAFSYFANIIPKEGILFVSADYPHIKDVITQAQCRIVTYGYNENAQLLIKDLHLDESGSRFSLLWEGKDMGSFRLPLWGSHNASNAAAAAGVCLHLGLSAGQIQGGFNTLKGVKRRQEIIAEIGDVIIIDDFAHHPTKVRETVKAVRGRYPDRRIISVFEPRTNTSRRNFFQDVYPSSFDGSDMVIIAPVFNPGQIEENKLMNPARLSQDIRERGIEAHTINGVDNIIDFLCKNIGHDDVILIMSNGGFDNIYEKLPKSLSGIKHIPFKQVKA